MNLLNIVDIVETRHIIEADLLINNPPPYPYNIRRVYSLTLSLKKDDIIHFEGQVAVKTPSGPPDSSNYFNTWFSLHVCKGQYGKDTMVTHSSNQNIDWQMHYLPLRVAGLYLALNDERAAEFNVYAFAASESVIGIGQSLSVKDGEGHFLATHYRRSAS